MRNPIFLCALLLLVLPLPRLRAATYPAPVEDDFVLPNFRFQSGESLPELKLHYRTIGVAQKNQSGVVRNAVLVLHGTGGSGLSLLRESFADALFGPGKLLDAANFYIVLPDGIGHGRSSKPSDGLHARFPHYNYADMVLAQYRLLTEKLGVNHLRLVIGTSMGGMQTWVWGEAYPDFMDALAPLASLPVEIAGRNRIQRRMIIDSIRKDPDWKNGEYDRQPPGLVSAVHLLILMGSSPLQMQKAASTRVAADKLLEEQMRARLKGLDANDLLYQVDASRDYNPAPALEKIKAPLLAINSADDEINPPELGILEREIKRVPRGRAIVIPISDQTRGHGTHSYADVWKEHLAQLLEESKRN